MKKRHRNTPRRAPKAILLERPAPPSDGLSFCRGADELEALGLCDSDGQLSGLGRVANLLVIAGVAEAGHVDWLRQKASSIRAAIARAEGKAP